MGLVYVQETRRIDPDVCIRNVFPAFACCSPHLKAEISFRLYGAGFSPKPEQRAVYAEGVRYRIEMGAFVVVDVDSFDWRFDQADILPDT